jgi:NAD(P)-dependent dehydrogenase (short-subunit alcohol dehydrogenase family)
MIAGAGAGARTPRVVCISGGASGIGAALVAAFLAAGDRVYAFSRRAALVEGLAVAHPEAGERLTALAGDVTDAGFRAGLVERIGADRGRLDVLINNAGIIRGPGSLEESLEDWRATLEVNLIAPFALTQVCAPWLERSEDPCVINMSSACASQAFSSCTSTSYSVSKAGLDMLTRRLALGLGPRGIRVNALAPGVVPTEIWGPGGEALAQRTIAERHVLRQRPVTPEDVAQAALYLAGARAVTGVVLPVDAGYALG